jgi:hypothetical protein
VNPSSLEAREKTVQGIVFEDANRSGIFDRGDRGIPGVVVSNQEHAVITGEDGRYRLPVNKKKAIIFVSKPAGYDLPLDKNNLPRFYYIHQRKGSPAGLKYDGIAPTGKLPASIDFPLTRAAVENRFEVLVTADPQTTDERELAFFRDEIITGMMSTPARFYLALGDIVYNDLALFEPMKRVTAQLGMPVHHVMGNHDMNFRVSNNMDEAETFKRIHGPDYYSFNYGRVHFVVLNTIKYEGWNKKENKAGKYTGFIHQRQLTWLKNDLSFVPEDHLVVLCMHIPLTSEIYREDATQVLNRGEVFKALENRKHLLALSGHMHYVEYLEFDAEDGWHGGAVFPSLVAGAGCGTWWHGPASPAGIPYGLATDGAPNGYFLFTFEDNRYNYRFCPSQSSSPAQMRINSPRGALTREDLAAARINVNIFAGTPRTVVTVRIDDRPGQTMERKVMNDPFFEKLVNEHPKEYKDWMKPSLCPHIWEAALPADLEPGIHRLAITARDHLGNTFTGFRIFQVENISL